MRTNSAEHLPLLKKAHTSESIPGISTSPRSVGWSEGSGPTALLAALMTSTLIMSVPASAATITATHDSLMCTSPDALARLILPGGRSRIGTPSEKSGDRQAALAGGCVDVPPDTHVEVQSTRTNTSIVTYDAQDGHGPRTLVAPNVNFSSTPAPQARAGEGCLHFAEESAEVTLSGVAQQRQARITRGGGNPESERDLITRQFVVLALDKPLCAQITGGIVAIPPTITREVGVEGSDLDTRSLLRPWIGKRVAVTGKLLWRAKEGEAFTDLYLYLTSSQVRSASP